MGNFCGRNRNKVHSKDNGEGDIRTSNPHLSSNKTKFEPYDPATASNSAVSLKVNSSIGIDTVPSIVETLEDAERLSVSTPIVDIQKHRPLHELSLILPETSGEGDQSQGEDFRAALYKNGKVKTRSRKTHRSAKSSKGMNKTSTSKESSIKSAESRNTMTTPILTTSMKYGDMSEKVENSLQVGEMSPALTSSSSLRSSLKSNKAKRSKHKVTTFMTETQVETTPSLEFGLDTSKTPSSLDKPYVSPKSRKSSKDSKKSKVKSSRSTEPKQPKVKSVKSLDSKKSKISSEKSLDSKTSKVKSTKSLDSKKSKISSEKSVDFKKSKVKSTKSLDSKKSKVKSTKSLDSKKSKVKSTKSLDSKKSKVKSTKSLDSKKSKVNSSKSLDSKKSKVKSTKSLDSKKSKVKSTKSLDSKKSKVKNAKSLDTKKSNTNSIESKKSKAKSSKSSQTSKKKTRSKTVGVVTSSATVTTKSSATSATSRNLPKKKKKKMKARRRSTFGSYRTYNDRETMGMHHPLVHARVLFENRPYCGRCDAPDMDDCSNSW